MQNSIYVENNINMDKEKRGLNADSDWKTRKKYKKQVDDPKKKTGQWKLNEEALDTCILFEELAQRKRWTCHEKDNILRI